MAQRVLTVLTCDLHDNDVDAVESLSFAVSGVSYDIDLCAAHAGRFRESLAPFLAAARKQRRQGGAARPGGRRRKPSAKPVAAAANSVPEAPAVRN